MINHITFSNKIKDSKNINENTIFDYEINSIKYKSNQLIDVINSFEYVLSVNKKIGIINTNSIFPVLSVNGQTGNIFLSSLVLSVNGQVGNTVLKFPVTSVNSQTKDVVIDVPVLSVNGLVDNVNLKTSHLINDSYYITINDISVLSVNKKYDNVILKISQFQNYYNFITSDDILITSVNGQTGDVVINIPVSSVNGKTSDVIIDFPVSSINGKTGNVIIDFPVSSVNEQTGNVVIDFPVSSVNSKTGNVVLKTSDIKNDSGYITSDNIPVSSINGQTGDVILKTSNIENDSGYITSDDIPISSVNGQTGDVVIDIPVSSVNGKTGHILFSEKSFVDSVNNLSGNINLTMSKIENDNKYITINNICVKKISITNSKSGTNSTTNNVKIFIPNKISQIANDSNFYNNINQFIKIQNNNESNAIICRTQKDAAFIDLKKCTGCGKCIQQCNKNAIKEQIIKSTSIYIVMPDLCINCQKCISSCEFDAIYTKKQ